MSAETTLALAVAVPAQLAQVDALMRLAFAPYMRRLGGREVAADAYGWFAGAIAQGDIYIALDGGEIVGAIATRRRDADLELALIGVSPTRQKSGIASFMIGRVAEIARSRGLKTLSLTTAEMMEDRIRLYRRHGFEIVRRGLPEHGKDAHMRVHMQRVLESSHAHLDRELPARS
jgi:ribosomal protein S18 acetylase RimI-like enzyme